MQVAKIMPIPFLYRLTNIISLLLFYLLKKRRELAIKNLKSAFSNLSDENAHRLAKKNFQSISKTAAETVLVYHNRYDINKHIINKNQVLNQLQKLIKDNKNGVIFLSMHFGNWEIGAQFLALNGYPAMGIGREGDNRLIETKITLPFRHKYGNTTIYKESAMIKMIRALKKNKSIGFLIDQKAGHQNSIKTTFFGKECYTTIITANMKIKFNPLIIPIFSKRVENGDYEIIIRMPKDTHLENKSIKDITQTYNDILQEVITQAPEQWFWMHNRWKLS